MTVWIIGPVAWDSVVYTDQFLKRGAFTQGTKFIERTGGTGANVARALCTAGVETGFVGYLGNDSYGDILRDELATSGIGKLAITNIDGPTSHVLIIVDGEGDRTILGLAADHLDRVSLQNVPLVAGDTVVFVLWRDHFAADLELAKAEGCNVVVGLDAVNDARVTGVSLAIGSHNDVGTDFDPMSSLHRFERIVITQGEQGAIEYSASGQVHQPAVPTQVVDATGAGDAFLAGYLAAKAKGVDSATERLNLGARWSAATIAAESSVPPMFQSI
jgi:sugar/nucleoside kinase (ribokinase family)